MPPRTPQKRTHSDSTSQRQAEAEIRGLLSKALGLRTALLPKVFALTESKVSIDGFLQDKKGRSIVIVEIYSRIGALKSAQKNKVLGDVLKLSFLEKAKADDWSGYSVRKIIAFADQTAARYLSSDSWGTAVAKLFGVETQIVPLSRDTADKVCSAQRAQDLRRLGA